MHSAGVETNLYLPVKRFLERLGFQVKGEIGGCDLVALSADCPPIVIIGELKLAFNLELVLQGVDRAGACDEVWLAVRSAANGRGREHDSRVHKLCRRLGFGLLVVHARGGVEIVVSPSAPMSRRDQRRRSRLVDEHRKRQGDPTAGGGSRQPIMTAYRQQALACASALASGSQRGAIFGSRCPMRRRFFRATSMAGSCARSAGLCVDGGGQGRAREVARGLAVLPGLLMQACAGL